MAATEFQQETGHPLSAAASRYELRHAAQQHLDDQERGTTPRTVQFESINYALMSGNSNLAKQAASHAASMLPVMEKHLKLSDATDTANYLNLAIAETLAGADARPRIERLLKVKPDSDPLTQALRWIVGNALGHKVAAPTLRKPPRWLTELTKAEPAQALDLVLLPDHDEWAEMQAFVLPLAYLLGASDAHSLMTFAGVGGHPERRGEVLYERSAPRPGIDIAFDPARRETWPGFDAVERVAGMLRVYHYLDQHWHAPIAFQPDIDTLPFLQHIDSSWRIVQATVSADVCRGIQADIDGKRCTHVLAFDPKHSAVAKDSLSSAAAHFGIALEAIDFRRL